MPDPAATDTQTLRPLFADARIRRGTVADAAAVLLEREALLDRARAEADTILRDAEAEARRRTDTAVAALEEAAAPLSADAAERVARLATAACAAVLDAEIATAPERLAPLLRPVLERGTTPRRIRAGAAVIDALRGLGLAPDTPVEPDPELAPRQARIDVDGGAYDLDLDRRIAAAVTAALAAEQGGEM